jgi:hypothetical protein
VLLVFYAGQKSVIIYRATHYRLSPFLAVYSDDF